MATDTKFKITRTSESRLADVDFDNLGFGRVFSDHMLEIRYTGGQWQQPEIKPYGTIEVEPALHALHYGQSVFEGAKAYHVDEDTVNLFRIEKNYERMARSCERICMPFIDRSTFLDGIRTLIKVDHQWVPRKEGNVLYIRPLISAFDSVIAANPSDSYRFYVMTSPVGAYYSKSVKLTTSQKYIRAAKGGVGAAKFAGNYGGSFFPARQAQQQGFDQVLWLDAVDHVYVEEVGTMNIFFVIDGVLITPELSGTILPGVTRNSVIQLARRWELPVEERRVNIAEVIEAGQNGTLEEAFGAGTAAVIAPIGEIHHAGTTVMPKSTQRGAVGQKLYDAIYDIQRSRRKDPFDWVYPIDVGE